MECWNLNLCMMPNICNTQGPSSTFYKYYCLIVYYYLYSETSQLKKRYCFDHESERNFGTFVSVTNWRKWRMDRKEDDKAPTLNIDAQRIRVMTTACFLYAAGLILQLPAKSNQTALLWTVGNGTEFSSHLMRDISETSLPPPTWLH